MYLHLIIFNIVVFSYYYYGMKTYIKYNNSEYAKELKYGMEKLECPIVDEYAEFIESIKKREYVNSFMEFFDYIHSISKVFVMRTFPEYIYMTFIPWFFVFIISYPVSVKLAYRYFRYGCIRNHLNKKINHNCSVRPQI